jgi:hypothetical protein
MAKFRNVTGMSQVVVLQGKKTIVENDGVIESQDGFSQIGFDKVADAVPATVSAGSIRRRRLVTDAVVSQFENKLQSVVADKDKALSQANEKVQELAKLSEANSNNFKKEFDELKELTLAISKQTKTMGEELAEFKGITFRRLEMLKGAVQAIELEIEQLYGKEEFVIEGDIEKDEQV